MTTGPDPQGFGEDLQSTARSIKAALQACGWDGGPVAAGTSEVAHCLKAVQVSVSGTGGADEHTMRARLIEHARTLVGAATLTVGYSGPSRAGAGGGGAGCLLRTSGAAAVRITATSCQRDEGACCELAAVGAALTQLAKHIGPAAQGLEILVRTRHRRTQQLLERYHPLRPHPEGTHVHHLCERILGRKHQPDLTAQLMPHVAGDQSFELARRLGRLGRRHAAFELPAELTHTVGERIAAEAGPG